MDERIQTQRCMVYILISTTVTGADQEIHTVCATYAIATQRKKILEDNNKKLGMREFFRIVPFTVERNDG